MRSASRLLATLVAGAALLAAPAAAQQLAPAQDSLAALTKRNEELHAAMAEVQTLAGLIPICANCESVRDDAGFWRSVEEFVGSRSAAQFPHAICNACGPKLYGEDWESPTGPSYPRAARKASVPRAEG